MMLGRPEDARPIAAALGDTAMETACQCASWGCCCRGWTCRSRPYNSTTAPLPWNLGRRNTIQPGYRATALPGRFFSERGQPDPGDTAKPTEFGPTACAPQLRQQTPDHNHVTELEALLVGGIKGPEGGADSVCPGQELEDLGQPVGSFTYLKRGADLRRTLMQYDVDSDIRTMELISRHYNGTTFDSQITGHDNNGHFSSSACPYRTTLVERIIGSHPDVYAAGELNNFAIELTRLAGEPGISKKTWSRVPPLSTLRLWVATTLIQLARAAVPPRGLSTRCHSIFSTPD